MKIILPWTHHISRCNIKHLIRAVLTCLIYKEMWILEMICYTHTTYNDCIQYTILVSLTDILSTNSFTEKLFLCLTMNIVNRTYVNSTYVHLSKTGIVSMFRLFYTFKATQAIVTKSPNFPFALWNFAKLYIPS